MTGCSGSSTIFTVNSALVNSCQEVCIPISVSNFVDIVSLQFSIHYDASLLEFVDINGFNLPNFDIGNFSLSNASAGNINVSWFNPVLTGVALNDNSEIFQICCNVTGNVGGTADIFISGTPTAIEVIHAADPIPVYSKRSGLGGDPESRNPSGSGPNSRPLPKFKAGNPPNYFDLGIVRYFVPGQVR